MPGKSIKYYKKALNLKETLSAANLATKYMEAGFIEEAHQILEKARKEDNVHENVGNCIFRLSNIEQNEMDIQSKAFKEANKQQNFIRQFAEAFFIKDISTNSIFSGKWKLCSSSLSLSSSSGSLFDMNTINITQSESEIIGLWGENNKFKLNGQAHNRGLVLKFYGQEDNLNMIEKNLFTNSYAFISQDFAQLKIILISSHNNNGSTIYIDLAKTN